MFVPALFIAVLGGASLAMQSPTNTALSGFVGKTQSTLISFTGGLLTFSLLTIIFGQGDITLAAGQPFWQLIGGVYGAYIVFAIVLCTPVLGVALTLMIIMLGRLLMGAVVDTFGLLEAAVIPVTPLRLMGIFVVLLGIVLIYIDKLQGPNATANAKAASRAKAKVAGVGRGANISSAQGGVGAANTEAVQSPNRRKAILYGLFALGAGIGGALQAATNAALSLTTGVFEAGVVSFAGGLIFVFTITMILQRGRLHPLPRGQVKPWMLIGGVWGAGSLTTTIFCTPILGVGLLVALAMGGQLTMGMVIDSLGLLGIQRARLGRWRVAGVATIAVGAAIIAVARMMAL